MNLLCIAGAFAAAGGVVGGVTDVAGTVGAAGGAAGVVGNSSPNQVRHFLILLQQQSEAGPSFAGARGD